MQSCKDAVDRVQSLFSSRTLKWRKREFHNFSDSNKLELKNSEDDKNAALYLNYLTFPLSSSIFYENKCNTVDNFITVLFILGEKHLAVLHGYSGAQCVGSFLVVLRGSCSARELNPGPLHAKHMMLWRVELSLWPRN